MGQAVVVDVSKAALDDRDYQVTRAALKAHERRHGRIPRGTIVLLRTGFGRYWPDRERYLGTAELGEQAVPKLHFPGLHPGGARWLVRERGIRAVGLDTASIDYGQSTAFESHRILGAANVPGFENVANLDRLPAEGALVIALPMKIKGGSGGPLRAMALVPRESRSRAGHIGASRPASRPWMSASVADGRAGLGRPDAGTSTRQAVGARLKLVGRNPRAVQVSDPV